MIEMRKELNNASETFEYVIFTLDLHGNALLKLFRKHAFLNDLDLDDVS